MKIAITGSHGFIGKHLMKRLDDFMPIDKKIGVDINSHRFDFEMEQYNPDIIVHLGANCSTSKSILDPKSDFIDNVMGTFNVLLSAKKLNAKIIFTSSVKAGTGTPYGTSKECGELYVREFGESYGVPYIINRPGTIYGEGQDGSEESGWLGWFIKASLLGERINIYGDGHQLRRVLHVDDYVDLLTDQINNFSSWEGVWTIDGGKENEVSLLQVLEHLNYDNYRHRPVRLGDVYDYPFISHPIDWKPMIGWKEGIDRTIKYYEEIL